MKGCLIVIKVALKTIEPYMYENGFKKRNRLFYKIQNDLAYCIEFERPSGLVYVCYYVMPLYIPHANRCYTYGKRLVLKENNATLSLTNDSTVEEVTKWAKQLFIHIKNTVFPLFEEFNTPEQFANNIAFSKQSTFLCTDIDILRLRFFTYAFLGDIKNASSIKSEYLEVVNKTQFLTDVVKERLLNEISTIDTLFSKEACSRVTWFKNTITETMKVTSLKR